MRESLFGASFVRSRYGPPACSPPGLTRPVRPSGPTGLPGLLLPGFQVPGSPHVPAGYHYGTKLRIVPAGLAPASTSASLAAPPSGLALLDCPGLPPAASAGSPVPASQFFCTGTGHRVEATNPWHSDTPLEPASCGRLLRRLVRSLSLRPSCLLASRAGQTWGNLPGPVESRINSWNRRVFGPDYLVTDWVGKRNSPGEVFASALGHTSWKP